MYNRKDHYYKRAKEEGFASRAVYKLEQIQSKFHIIKKSDRVLDLGAAPGGWMQVVSDWVGSRGLVVGVDLLPLKIQLKPNMKFVRGDINCAEVIDRIVGEVRSSIVSRRSSATSDTDDRRPTTSVHDQRPTTSVHDQRPTSDERRATVVISDMAPNTSGVAFKDAYLSYELCLMALDVARRFLKPGGHLVTKIFQGEEVENFKKELRTSFKKVEHYIPPATREGSKELYMVATKFNIQA